jgi:hypothetical protein
MSSAISIDGQRGPPIPPAFGARSRPQQVPAKHPSPLPDSWSEGTKPLRELAAKIEKIVQGR